MYMQVDAIEMVDALPAVVEWLFRVTKDVILFTLVSWRRTRTE